MERGLGGVNKQFARQKRMVHRYIQTLVYTNAYYQKSERITHPKLIEAPSSYAHGLSPFTLILRTLRGGRGLGRDGVFRGVTK